MLLGRDTAVKAGNWGSETVLEEISDTILEIRKIIQFIEKTFALDMGI